MIRIYEMKQDYGHGPVSEWFVYVGDTLVRTCPSLDMAREVAAGYR